MELLCPRDLRFIFELNGHDSFQDVWEVEWHGANACLVIGTVHLECRLEFVVPIPMMLVDDFVENALEYLVRVVR
mgnify:CR=1 FL=1